MKRAGDDEINPMLALVSGPALGVPRESLRSSNTVMSSFFYVENPNPNLASITYLVVHYSSHSFLIPCSAVASAGRLSIRNM